MTKSGQMIRAIQTLLEKQETKVSALLINQTNERVSKFNSEKTK